MGEGPRSSQRPDCVGRGACPDPAEVPLRWPGANRGPLSARRGGPCSSWQPLLCPWPAGGCHLARLPTLGGGHEGVRRGGSARVYAQGAKEARGEERSAYPAWGGFHLCAVPEHPGRPSAVRPLLTTTSPPPSRGGAADPRLSAGGVSRNLWLCFSKVAFTYSATCSPVSSDRRMRPGNPSRCRAVPTPECPLVPPPGPCPPPGSPCSDFSLPVLRGDITDPYGIHYTRPALLTDPVFVHLPTC